MAKILVIEDMEGVRLSIVTVLERNGHTVSTAENGIIGVEKAKEDSFDLIITDILMPEQDGIEVINELREHNPNTIILAVSGGGTQVSVDVLEGAVVFAM